MVFTQFLHLFQEVNPEVLQCPSACGTNCFFSGEPKGEITVQSMQRSGPFPHLHSCCLLLFNHTPGTVDLSSSHPCGSSGTADMKKKKAPFFFPSLFKGWVKSAINYILHILFIYKHIYKFMSKQMHALIILTNLHLQISSIKAGQCFPFEICFFTASRTANLLLSETFPGSCKLNLQQLRMCFASAGSLVGKHSMCPSLI